MLEVVSVGVGLLVVLLASLFKNTKWEPKYKLTLATVLSVVGGFVAVLATGSAYPFSTDLFASISMVFAASQLLYKFILDGSRFEKELAETDLLHRE